MPKLKSVLKTAFGAAFLFTALFLNTNYAFASAAITQENLTEKSYSFDVESFDSSDAKALYDLSDDEIPSRFDLREKIKIFVDDQEMTNLCDLYATVKSIETNYALKTGKSVDLSETFLDYISSNYFYGTREQGSVTDGSEIAYTAMYGLPKESEVPNGTVDLSKIMTAKPVCRVVSTVDFRRLSLTDETSEKLLPLMKQHLMKYGSLATGICSPDSAGDAYNSETCAYFYNEKFFDSEIYTDHQISIIGWDDNFSKNNFHVTPSRDGAFICVNSWGEEFGENGFFYISYDTIDEFWLVKGILDTEDCTKRTEYTYCEALHTIGEVKSATRKDKYYGVIFDTKEKGEALKNLVLTMTVNPSKTKLYLNPYDEEFNSEKYIYLGETEAFSGTTLMSWKEPVKILGDKFALVFEIEYSDRMIDDFISNDPSVSRDGQRVLGGHFYNSDKIDSDFQLMDYDLQLFVYTEKEGAEKTPGGEGLSSGDTSVADSTSISKSASISENALSSGNAANPDASRTAANNQFFIIVVIALIVALTVVLLCIILLVRRSQRGRK